MDSRAVRTFRVFVIATAVVAVSLGLVAILWPRPSLVVVALVFGVYLVAAGALRAFAAVRGHGTAALWRWTAGAVGVLVAGAGLVCLVDQVAPLVLLAALAGGSLLAEGTVALVGAVTGHPGSSRIPTIASGMLSLAAGVAVLVAPTAAVAVFVVLAGAVLVAAGAAALLLLPARTDART